MSIVKKTITLVKIFANFKHRKMKLNTLPIKLWVETSAACNLKCVMCPNKDLAVNEKGLMSFDLFKKIVDEAASFVNDIYIHHRGEPFLHPQLFNMIRYAKRRGLAVRFHSNACLMTEEKARQLLDAGPDLVSFSIDGFDKATYEEVRVNGVFEETIGNVVRLAQLKTQGMFTLPYIVVERIDFKKHRTAEHEASIQLMTQQFLDAGVDEVIAKEEYEWAVDDPSRTVEHNEYSVCTFPWYAMVICYDGTVTPCPQDYMAAMKMGSLRKNTIAEVWNDAPYQDLRRRLASDVSSLALCKKCDRIMRKHVGGVPFQYALTFLADQFLGYGKFRKMLGTYERNN